MRNSFCSHVLNCLIMVGRGIDLCIWIVGIIDRMVKLTRHLFSLQAQENADCQIKIAVQVFIGLKELLTVQVWINAMQQDQILLDLVFGLGGKEFHARSSKQKNYEKKRREKLNQVLPLGDFFLRLSCSSWARLNSSNWRIVSAHAV